MFLSNGEGVPSCVITVDPFPSIYWQGESFFILSKESCGYGEYIYTEDGLTRKIDLYTF